MSALQIVAPVAGRLLGWVPQGLLPDVEPGALLCEVMSTDGARLEVRAPAAGKLQRLADRGATVEAGAPLAELRGTTAQPDALGGSVRGETHASKGSTPTAAPRPVERLTARQPPRPAPVVEELELDPPAAPRPVERPPVRAEEPAAVKPKARPRTRHATYHVTDDQRERLARMVLELRLAGGELGNVTESEAVRAALELLLSLPGEALAATLRANRERERAGRYGVGWPRPGKGSGRG